MKKHGWLVGVAFFAGVLLANLIGRQASGAFEVSSAYEVTDERRLFCYLLLERGKTVFLCFLLQKVLGTEGFRLIAEGIFGALLGAVVVCCIQNIGIAGILVALCGGFPHWCCYLLAFFVYIKGKKSEVDVLPELLCVVCVAFGIVLEAYVNPGLMRNILGKIC